MFTKWKPSQNKHTLFTTSSPSKTSTIIDKEERTIEINKNYLLAGGSIFIGLIIFVILLQLYTCKRSTTAGTHTFKRRTCKEMGKSDKPEEKVQHDIELVSNELSLPLTKRKSNFNQPAACDYYDEVIEIRSSTSFSNASQECESPRFLPNSKHAYLPLTVENSYLSPQIKHDDLEQREGHSSETTSDLYLQPIHVI